MANSKTNSLNVKKNFSLQYFTQNKKINAPIIKNK